MGHMFKLKLSIRQLALALALADHADDHGRHVYPSVGHMAWKLGISKRQVQRLLVELRDMGLLVEVTPARQHRPAEYRLDPMAVAPKPDPPRGDVDATAGDSPGVTFSAPGVTKQVARGDRDVTLNLKKQRETTTEGAAHVDEARRLSHLFGELQARAGRQPSRITPDRVEWVEPFCGLLDRGTPVAQIEHAMRYAARDDFWRTRIRRPAKLAEHLETVLDQAGRPPGHDPGFLARLAGATT
jgi:hypothetical protein